MAINWLTHILTAYNKEAVGLKSSKLVLAPSDSEVQSSFDHSNQSLNFSIDIFLSEIYMLLSLLFLSA